MSSSRHLALKFAKFYHFSSDSMDYLVVTQFYYAALNLPLSLMFLFLVLHALLCDLCPPPLPAAGVMLS